MRYIANAPADQKAMLERIGAKSIDELFASIPKDIRFSGSLDLGPALSEQELIQFFGEMAGANRGAQMSSFLGGGMYRHFVPSHVDQLVLRSEIYTAYTPYQAEIAQGTLQTIFEFQSMICMLTGLEVSNASLYDGATACSEAVLMADRIQRKRNRIVISALVHPYFREVCDTYLSHLDLDVVTLPMGSDGRTDRAAAEEAIDENTSCVLIQSPNFLGCIEEVRTFADLAHEKGAMLATAMSEPLSLGIVRSPGEDGADIVCGEGQSFGIPLQYGGPSLGFFATRDKYVRQMPGRLVGKTVDVDGKDGFVLALATREQHIRRDKATSNICTNQGLFMTMATIYLCTLGKVGIRELAKLNLSKATYLKNALAVLPGVEVPYTAPTFNEFVVRLPKPAADIANNLESADIVAGLDLGRFKDEWANDLLVCATEMNSREEIDHLVTELEATI